MSKPIRLFFSSGQIARELGTTVSIIRKLCESGTIEAQRTPGGQWRIPVQEVDRLKREGLPEIPRELPASGDPSAPGHGHPRLLAEPSDDAIHAADDVVRLENDVRGIQLTRQREEQLDWFRERQRRQEEEVGEELARQQAAEAEQRRQDWENEWTEYGFGLVPEQAPRETKLKVHEAVKKALIDEGPETPDSVVEQVVEAAVEAALHPWRSAAQIQGAIQAAANRLPSGAKRSGQPTHWQVRAMQLAADEIAQLREGAGSAEIEAAAMSAAAQVSQEFEHAETIEVLVRDTWRHLSGATQDETEDGQNAVRRALEGLQVGASLRGMATARDAALAPFRAEVARRQDNEMRQDLIRWAVLPSGLTEDERESAVEDIKNALDDVPLGSPRADLERAREGVIEEYRGQIGQRQQKKRLIEDELRGIFLYLMELQKEWEFDKLLFQLERELKEAIRKRLESELSGAEPGEQVKNRVRRLVRQELGIE